MSSKSPSPASPKRVADARKRASGSAPSPRSTGRGKASAAKKINLALQGGGAHGAFTWGVLDHLLCDERIDIEGISGTSAGAINAVLLADGLARGGAAEARKRLDDFWRAASRDGDLPALQRSVVDRMFSFVPYEGSPVQICSTRYRVTFRPTTSIRSTSIRSTSIRSTSIRCAT
jgi:NTE family protein